jgi:serine/threonine protein phosphatase PrpC
MLSDNEISEIIKSTESKGLKSSAQTLIQKANDNGGLDNSTVVLLRMREE